MIFKLSRTLATICCLLITRSRLNSNVAKITKTEKKESVTFLLGRKTHFDR